ncbi:MAG: hypothetical protein AAF402_05760 [Pseudomonadota bacterium]
MPSLHPMFRGFFIATLLYGCSTVGDVVTDENLFRQKVVDRNLTWPGGYAVRFLSTGQITGRFPEGLVTGVWVWEDQKFCREMTAGHRKLPRECLTVELRESQIRFKRENGRYFNPYNISDS